MLYVRQDSGGSVLQVKRATRREGSLTVCKISGNTKTVNLVDVHGAAVYGRSFTTVMQ